jgi:hypothetical protein
VFIQVVLQAQLPVDIEVRGVFCCVWCPRYVEKWVFCRCRVAEINGVGHMTVSELICKMYWDWCTFVYEDFIERRPTFDTKCCSGCLVSAILLAVELSDGALFFPKRSSTGWVRFLKYSYVSKKLTESGSKFFLKNVIFPYLRNSRYFTQPESLMPCSQKPDTHFYSEQVECSPDPFIMFP